MMINHVIFPYFVILTDNIAAVYNCNEMKDSSRHEGRLHFIYFLAPIFKSPLVPSGKSKVDYFSMYTVV